MRTHNNLQQIEVFGTDENTNKYGVFNFSLPLSRLKYGFDSR